SSSSKSSSSKSSSSKSSSSRSSSSRSSSSSSSSTSSSSSSSRASGASHSSGASSHGRPKKSGSASAGERSTSVAPHISVSSERERRLRGGRRPVHPLVIASQVRRWLTGAVARRVCRQIGRPPRPSRGGGKVFRGKGMSTLFFQN